MTYHLELGQHWRCPVTWCSHWKGTPQDFVDHIRLRHQVGLSVKASNLGRWFPPWTVARMAWNAALKPKVSGVAMTLCSLASPGPDWSTVYRVYRDYVPHLSLRRMFMARLSDFTHRACAEARSVAKRGRDSSTKSVSSPCRPVQLPLGPTHYMPDHVPLASKAARAAVSATSPDDADVSSAPMPTSLLPLGLAHRVPVLSLPAWTATCTATSPVGRGFHYDSDR